MSFSKARTLLPPLRSHQEVPPVLPVQGDRGRGLHEAAGARRNALLLQGRLQHLRARGVRGERALPVPDAAQRKPLRRRGANPALPPWSGRRSGTVPVSPLFAASRWVLTR